MKIIEALKAIKHLRNRNQDFIGKIAANSASMSLDTPAYSDPKAQIASWVDSVRDTALEIERLMRAVTYTNCMTMVSIELPHGGKTRTVTKSISEWLVRRNEGAAASIMAMKALTNKNLKAALVKVQGTEDSVMNTVVLHYDTAVRDQHLSDLTEELSLIASRLEIVNATVDLLQPPS
jgi:hypothetical protein